MLVQSCFSHHRGPEEPLFTSMTGLPGSMLKYRYPGSCDVICVSILSTTASAGCSCAHITNTHQKNTSIYYHNGRKLNVTYFSSLCPSFTMDTWSIRREYFCSKSSPVGLEEQFICYKCCSRWYRPRRSEGKFSSI